MQMKEEKKGSEEEKEMSFTFLEMILFLFLFFCASHEVRFIFFLCFMFFIVFNGK